MEKKLDTGSMTFLIGLFSFFFSMEIDERKELQMTSVYGIAVNMYTHIDVCYACR